MSSEFPNGEGPSARFLTALCVEAYKLRRSLALWLAAIVPLLIAAFLLFNLLRLQRVTTWAMNLQSAGAIWAFFMLPMSVTALAALIAHIEHGPRTWDFLRALPRPRWHLYTAKAACMLILVAMMSLLLALVSILSVQLAGWLKPAVAVTGTLDIAGYLWLLGRIALAAWLLVAVQLWISLRYASFVPALAVGIGGTFFAVVAPSARIGAVMPWQIPVNQLASSPARANLALLIGCVGGCLVLAVMVWKLSRREVLS